MDIKNFLQAEKTKLSNEKADALPQYVLAAWKLEAKRLEKTHSMRLITTRRYYAGRHKVTVHVNGQVVAENSFQLLMP